MDSGAMWNLIDPKDHGQNFASLVVLDMTVRDESLPA
jgi:hypothetical protein